MPPLFGGKGNWVLINRILLGFNTNRMSSEDKIIGLIREVIKRIKNQITSISYLGFFMVNQIVIIKKFQKDIF